MPLLPLRENNHPNCPPFVSLHGINVVLGGKRILRDVSCSIPRGEITALIGLNGCGKSTLLRTLLRELPCTGILKYACGHDHSRPDPRFTGYVPQRLLIEAKFPITVAELIALALQRRPLFFGISRKLRSEMERILERVGMAHHLASRIEELSGGELQRVLLGLALEPKPELLLLDEPTAAIDFRDQEHFHQLIAEVNRTMGVTVVLVSHYLETIRGLAHHVIGLRDGCVCCSGPAAEVLTQENIMRTFGYKLLPNKLAGPFLVQ